MKIGIITGFLYPYAKSGPAIVAYNIANNLAKKNIEVTIFGAIPQKESIKIEEYYHPKVELKLHVEKNTFSMLYCQFKYIKQIKNKDFDILHFENLPGARGIIIVPLLHTINKDFKIIQKIHGWPPTELNFRFDRYFKKILYRFHWGVAKRVIQSYCDEIIVNSNFMKETVNKVFHEHIEVIPNGVDLNTWKPSNRIDLEGNKNIVFWGRFSSEKGVDLIIKSAKSILKTFPDLHFYLIGDGPIMASLQRQSKNIKLERNIHFMGFLPQKEIIKYASTADIAIFPSRYEPFGMMILEAMALKKPIIATNIGGIKEIIQNYNNGILVNPDSNELSEAVIKLLKDNELQNVLSINAYETSKKYDWDVVCENYIDYYQMIVGDLK